MNVPNYVKRLRKAWGDPKTIVEAGDESDFRIACSFEDAHSSECSSASLPAALRDWWVFVSRARLFEDVTYGQSGLVMWNEETSARQTAGFFLDRSADSLSGDLVVGEFLGDSDLLLVRNDPEADDFGGVVVALPIDSREDWYSVAVSLDEFLETFAMENGLKYWESESALVT